MVCGMGRTVIGICAALERARWGVWDQPAALLPMAYVEAVQRAGGLALILPPDESLQRDPDDLLDLIDGLMLAGGADIDPGTYGQAPDPHTVETVPERDRFEVALTRAAIARGMQLINVACGGTLVQHLPDHLGHEEHRRVLGSFEGADHDVDLRDGSLAANAAGEVAHATKSHHHQGVDRLGDNLVVSGFSTLDELPEAVEIPERRFVLGVQWHPEADPASAVVAAFVRAAGDASSALQLADAEEA
jgi:putative glutamine amidotransferase